MTREEAIEMLKTVNMMLRSPDGKPISDACDALDMAIEALSADAVEVVRCGECKHMIADGRCMEFADDGIIPSATDFCSYGERRAESEVEE